LVGWLIGLIYCAACCSFLSWAQRVNRVDTYLPKVRQQWFNCASFTNVISVVMDGFGFVSTDWRDYIYWRCCTHSSGRSGGCQTVRPPCTCAEGRFFVNFTAVFSRKTWKTKVHAQTHARSKFRQSLRLLAPRNNKQTARRDLPASGTTAQAGISTTHQPHQAQPHPTQTCLDTHQPHTHTSRHLIQKSNPPKLLPSVTPFEL
jgi:hypothetical protein